MVITKWSIDCSLSKSENCVFIANIGIGFLAKQSFVRNSDANSDNNVDEMLKVCQWYSNNDREWLWDKFWNMSFYSFILCTITGAVACALLSIGSCYVLEKKTSRVLSYIFGILAILSIAPFLIYWKSDICSKDTGVCDQSQSNCVDTCHMGNGSWQLFASSFIWISAMVTTWSLHPEEEPILVDKDDASQSTDDDNDDNDSDSNSNSNLMVAYGHDEVISRPKIKSFTGGSDETITRIHAETSTSTEEESRTNI